MADWTTAPLPSHAERVAAAARLVRDGTVYPLNGAGQFGHGVTAAGSTAGTRDTIDPWGRREIAGRGVVLDIEALLGGAGDGFDPASPRAVTVGELEAARAATGVRWQPGDVLLLHTGFLAWHARQPASVRGTLADVTRRPAIGLERSEDMARYLWNAHVAAVVSDSPSVEVWTPGPHDEARPSGFPHRMLTGQFGIAVGELWWLDDLARSCRADGRHEVFFTAAPPGIPGGAGGAASALAIK